MRVLVTGGAGFIGSIAVALLIENGFQVTVLDDLSSGHIDSLSKSARFVSGSVLDSIKVRDALEGCDAVMHFAGKSLVGESVKEPEVYKLVNIGGAENLLLNMRKMKVRKLVFSSSAATYGNVDTVPILETVRTRPTNPYGFTKLEIERLISLECGHGDLNASSLRYFNVAGALRIQNGWLSEKHEPETHLIPNVLKGNSDNPIKIFGTDWPTKDGTCIRDYVHVVDLFEAHLLALQSIRNAGHQILNVGSGKGYSVLEIIESARKLTGLEIAFTSAPRRNGDPAILVADIGKAKNTINWQPRYGIEKMIMDTFESTSSII